MKHLRLFETENEYQEAINTLDLPCITYVEETSEIELYPKVNCCIATYNISDTLYNSRLLNSSFDMAQIDAMFIDGVEVEPTNQYTFTTTGEHTVKIILNNNFTNAANMFSRCTSLTSLDLSNFDTSNVTSMNYMFSRCQSLTSLDLSNFDTSNVTDMDSMFYTCESLTSLDLSSFDTSNVTDMNSMFSTCTSLTSLDLSSFDTSNVISSDWMVANCSSLTSLKMMGDINKMSTPSNMFFNITTTGTFYYNSAYDYSKIIAKLPSTWTAVAV